MNDERTEEDAALYALGLLSTAGAREFADRLAGDAELRELVRDLEETAASLAHSVPQHQPPPAAFDRLLSTIRGDSETERPARGVPAWVPWAVAAGFAAVAGFLGLERGQMKRELSALQHEDNLSKLRIATLVSQVENGAESVGAVAWDATQQRGVLTIQKMPRLDPAQDYQLWVIDPQYKQPISGGVVRVDDAGAARLVFTVDVPIGTADKFAISRERKGGVPQVEGPIVMAGQ